MVQIGVNSEKHSLEGEGKQSAVSIPVDTASNEEKEKIIEKTYKHVAVYGLATLTSLLLCTASFGNVASMYHLYWLCCRNLNDWLGVFFIVSWVCVYAFTLRKPQLRNADHPNKKAVFLALAAWAVPVSFLYFWLLDRFYSPFPSLLACVLPVSLALTWARKRFAALQCLRRVHPLLLIPATVAVGVAAFQVVRIFVCIHTYGEFYSVGIPLSILILTYVHCNIEVCLRRSPSMSPVAITHQLFLDAPYFIKIFFKYFGVNTSTTRTAT